MPQILFVTVGGSHQPIVSAISALAPDRVIFICSDGGSDKQVVGDGKPCEVRQNGNVVERLPNIPTQLNLENFNSDTDVIRVQADDLKDIYEKISLVMRELSSQPQNDLKVDYTGGTKTMSVGLALAALDNGCKLHLTTGQRTNIIKIDQGELTRRVRSSSVVVRRTLDMLVPAFQKMYNYPALLSEMQRLRNGAELDESLEKQCSRIHDLSIAFESWDTFDHCKALNSLKFYFSEEPIRNLGLFLKKVIASRAAIDSEAEKCESIKGNGYEIIIDLLLNAERRAYQKRFDDAVARLYRALEMLAQVHLRQKYDIRTSDVDLEKLPEDIQAGYRELSQPISLDLLKSYELLTQLNDETLGRVYKEQKSKLKDTLKIRNHSIMAHGFTPVTEKTYQDFHDLIKGFFTETTLLENDWQNYQFPQVF